MYWKVKMNKRNENLDKLLNGFYNETEAQEFKSNLEFTSRVFSTVSSPKPSAQLKDQITAQLIKQHNSKLRVHFTLEAAAAVILIAAISIFFIIGKSTDSPSILTASLWQSSNLTLDDSELFEIENALNDISDQLITMDNSDSSELANSLIELQTDFIDLNENFWKG